MGRVPRPFANVYGVDFSGARLAGRTLWVAAARREGSRLHVKELFSLEEACGDAGRERALPFLVDLIRRSDDALWAIDAPFGLPVEILDSRMTWHGLLRFVRAWRADGYDLGTWCVERARALGGPLHIYRPTDREAKTPFDCYHYRIIYQTFHAMRDVLWPLRRWRETAILPFQYDRLGRARRIVFETCPSSTLRRRGLPYRRYKQPEGGSLLPERREVRLRILRGLSVSLDARQRTRILSDPGGDALDAVIAAVGGAEAWAGAPHTRVAADPRIRREGFVYA